MSLRIRQGPPPGSGSRRMGGPPYPPREAGLGGIPDPIPDVPATAVFLFFYVVFAVVHIVIFKKNKARGHKFIFNGALFGFCKIRIISMILRIVWAYYPRNVSLGIAAQVFVYAGTIILYITNWFFIQRVVRAQHPRFGWSAAYRALHRVSLILLIISLIMIIITSVWKSFTLDENMLRIFRYLGNSGQTYFAAFCFAPLVLISLSGLVPRRRTEKFGAGRLSNNIAILVITVIILSAGAIFRCVINWLPPTPARTSRGQPIDPPWYYSKICFYLFNFTTELIVVIFYAVARVDLRFHIPDGSKEPGDYARKASHQDPYKVSLIGDEKNLKRATTSLALGAHPNLSSETLYEYQASLFDDSHTLADSLRYPSSTLEVDSKTGHWKVKRASQPGSIHSRYSLQYSPVTPVRNSHSTDDSPQVPDLPTDWPLRDFPASAPLIDHPSPKGKGIRSSPLRNEQSVLDPVSQAYSQLEGNSSRTSIPPPPPPHYDTISWTERSRSSNQVIKKTYQPNRSSGLAISTRPGSDIPSKYTNSSPATRKSLDKAKRYSTLQATHAPASKSEPDLSQPRPQAPSHAQTKRDFSFDPVPAQISTIQPHSNSNSSPSTRPRSDLPKKYNYAPVTPSTPTTLPRQSACIYAPLSTTAPASPPTAYSESQNLRRSFSFERGRRGDEYEGFDSVGEAEVVSVRTGLLYAEQGPRQGPPSTQRGEARLSRSGGKRGSGVSSVYSRGTCE